MCVRACTLSGRCAPRPRAAANGRAAPPYSRAFQAGVNRDRVGAYVRLDTYGLRIYTHTHTHAPAPAHINKTRDTRARRVCVKDGAPRSITGQPFLRHYSESSLLGTEGEGERDGERQWAGEICRMIFSRFLSNYCLLQHRLVFSVDDIADCSCFFISEEGFFFPLYSSRASTFCQVAWTLSLSSQVLLFQKTRTFFWIYIVVSVIFRNSDVIEWRTAGRSSEG